MYNISPLFYQALSSDRFLNHVSINEDQERMLLEARKLVRNAIRSAFGDARNYLLGQSDISERDINWISKIKPKFMTQGSYAYKTLNSPCYLSQDIDLDDGVYLPMSLLNGAPEANKDWFFSIVDGGLMKLAKNQGWNFEKKEFCATIKLPQQAHIDVPLYAIPDKRYVEMSEAIVALNKQNRSLSDVIYSDDLYTSKPYLLEEEELYLATRKSGWKKSDPLEIANWFKQEISIKGRRLRRVCRFLKAWRDYVWEKGGPSSIALMICAADLYPEEDNERDDLALLSITKGMPEKLRGQILNPASKYREVIYPRGGVNTEEVASAAENLNKVLEVSINGILDKAQVPKQLKSQFGQRMPQNSELIKLISSAAIVRSTSARKVKPKLIPNSKSG